MGAYAIKTMNDEFLEMLDTPEFQQYIKETKEAQRAKRRTGNPNGRPLKYPSLGDMSMVRMPTRLHSSFHQLCSELDRLSDNQDPDELLSSIIDSLTEQ